MNYYTIIIQTAKDQSTNQSISKYDTLDAAEAAFHGELSYALNAKNLLADTVVVIDENGTPIYTKSWVNTEMQAELAAADTASPSTDVESGTADAETAKDK